MSITAVDPHEAIQKPRRIRKTHAKVKTGCITCKIRRKKCDEVKPNCLRCVNTGRKCDGYDPQVLVTTGPWATSSTFSSTPPVYALAEDKDDNQCIKITASPLFLARRPTPDTLSRDRNTYTSASICPTPSAIAFSCDVDFHCFDYFRLRTGPQIQSYFESSLWTTGVFKAAFQHPIVLKAATAVGAVHQRYNHGISREAFEYCAISDRLYREAAADFADFRRRSSYTESYHEVCVIVSMLFSLFEGFQGNWDRGVQHISFGLKSFWRRPSSVTYSESRYHNDDFESSFFFNLYQSIYDRAIQLFDTLPNRLAYDPTRPLPPIPQCFDSLEDARDVLFTDADWILHTPVRLWLDPEQCRRLRNNYVSRNLQWSVAIAELKQMRPERTAAQVEATRLLMCLRDMVHLLLYLIFFINLDESRLPLLNASVLAKFLSGVGNAANMELSDDASVNLDSPLPNLRMLDDSGDDMILDGDDDDTPIVTSRLLWKQITNQLDLRTRLNRIRMLASTITDDKSPFAYVSHSLGMDSGIGPPLAHMPIPFGSSKTRHIMFNVVKNDNCSPLSDLLPLMTRKTAVTTTEDRTTDPKVWSLLGGYSFIELFASMEEHAVLTAAQDLIPTHLAPKWVDFRCFLEERRLLVRYCRPDGLDPDSSRGLIWVQEWIKF